MVDSSPPRLYNTHMKTFTLSEEETSTAYTFLRDAYTKVREDIEDAVQWPEECDEEYIEDAKATLAIIGTLLDKLAK